MLYVFRSNYERDARPRGLEVESAFASRTDALAAPESTTASAGSGK
jgi:hypothetical protein